MTVVNDLVITGTYQGKRDRARSRDRRIVDVEGAGRHQRLARGRGRPDAVMADRRVEPVDSGGAPASPLTRGAVVRDAARCSVRSPPKPPRTGTWARTSSSRSSPPPVGDRPRGTAALHDQSRRGRAGVSVGSLYQYFPNKGRCSPSSRINSNTARASSAAGHPRRVERRAARDDRRARRRRAARRHRRARVPAHAARGGAERVEARRQPRGRRRDARHLRDDARAATTINAIAAPLMAWVIARAIEGHRRGHGAHGARARRRARVPRRADRARGGHGERRPAVVPPAKPTVPPTEIAASRRELAEAAADGALLRRGHVPQGPEGGSHMARTRTRRSRRHHRRGTRDALAATSSYRSVAGPALTGGGDRAGRDRRLR